GSAMIAQEMKSAIDAFCVRVRQENPLFAAARTGTMTPAILTDYVSNIGYFINHTQSFLHLAAARSKAQGYSDLEAFFQQKIVEETGHEVWDEADVNELSKQYKTHAPAAVTHAAVELIDFVRNNIQKDPFLYLPYIFFVEYFTVIAVP